MGQRAKTGRREKQLKLQCKPEGLLFEGPGTAVKISMREEWGLLGNQGKEPTAQPIAEAKVQRCEKVSSYQRLSELRGGAALKKNKVGGRGKDRHQKHKVMSGISEDTCMKNVELFLLVMGSHCSILPFL